MEMEKKVERMIHIRLPETLHKRLRILTAELDTTIQKWVAEIVIKELEKEWKKKGH